MWILEQILPNFSYFVIFLEIMSKCWYYKFMEVLDEMFIDECSDFDPDIADSLSDSSK